MNPYQSMGAAPWTPLQLWDPLPQSFLIGGGDSTVSSPCKLSTRISTDSWRWPEHCVSTGSEVPRPPRYNWHPMPVQGLLTVQALKHIHQTLPGEPSRVVHGVFLGTQQLLPIICPLLRWEMRARIPVHLTSVPKLLGSVNVTTRKQLGPAHQAQRPPVQRRDLSLPPSQLKK